MSFQCSGAHKWHGKASFAQKTPLAESCKVKPEKKEGKLQVPGTGMRAWLTAKERVKGHQEHCCVSLLSLYLGLTRVSPCSERRNEEGADGACSRDKTGARLRLWGEGVLHQSWAAQQLTAQLCPYETAQAMTVLKTRQQNLHSCQHFPFTGEKNPLFWL